MLWQKAAYGGKGLFQLITPVLPPTEGKPDETGWK